MIDTFWQVTSSYTKWSYFLSWTLWSPSKRLSSCCSSTNLPSTIKFAKNEIERESEGRHKPLCCHTRSKMIQASRYIKVQGKDLRVQKNMATGKPCRDKTQGLGPVSACWLQTSKSYTFWWSKRSLKKSFLWPIERPPLCSKEVEVARKNAPD